MREKQLTLVKALLKQPEWTTARQLASRIGISERSVKSYIGEINYLHPKMIQASRKGYRIEKGRAEKWLGENAERLPETPAERVKYIITELLTNDSDSQAMIDLYDVSEQIFVSLETLKKDMVKVRQKLKEYGLYVNVSNSVVVLEGKEADKRKLLSSILYEEFNKNILNLEVVQNAFPEYDLERLKEIILTECKEYHYFINDYAMVNLILDMVISMDRIRKNCTFGEQGEGEPKHGIQEMELSRQIALRVKEAFSIVFEGPELWELTSLLLSRLVKVDYDSISREGLMILYEPECLRIVDQVMAFLNENYFIDTGTNDFLIKFTIHIGNLLRRLKNNYTTRNPLTEHIKNSCPLIFECAVGVADCLHQITGHKVEEDEIAYIALHIGSNLETYEKQKDKLSCILLCPQYYDLSDIMMERIMQEFADVLVVRFVITKGSELCQLKNEDMIISTIELDGVMQKYSVFVNPFLTRRDMDAIWKKIREIKQEKKRRRLRDMLLQITSPQLFCKNGGFQDRNQALEYMIHAMEQGGYVKEGFLEKVEERECHSSTAFGRLAVPHSLNMDAYKTGMYILLSDRPIPWQEQMVNVVLLFAIHREDRALFHEVFDNLIVLLLEFKNLDRVLQSDNYETFIDAIMCCEE